MTAFEIMRRALADIAKREAAMGGVGPGATESYRIAHEALEAVSDSVLQTGGHDREDHVMGDTTSSNEGEW